MGDHKGNGGIVKFVRYFSLVGIAKNCFLSSPLRHRGSRGEGCTLKYGRYFSLVGIAMSFLLSPTLDFYHEIKEGRWIFST